MFSSLEKTDGVVIELTSAVDDHNGRDAKGDRRRTTFMPTEIHDLPEEIAMLIWEHYGMPDQTRHTVAYAFASHLSVWCQRKSVVAVV